MYLYTCAYSNSPFFTSQIPAFKLCLYFLAFAFRQDYIYKAQFQINIIEYNFIIQSNIYYPASSILSSHVNNPPINNNSFKIPNIKRQRLRCVLNIFLLHLFFYYYIYIFIYILIIFLVPYSLYIYTYFLKRYNIYINLHLLYII